MREGWNGMRIVSVPSVLQGLESVSGRGLRVRSVVARPCQAHNRAGGGSGYFSGQNQVCRIDSERA